MKRLRMVLHKQYWVQNPLSRGLLDLAGQHRPAADRSRVNTAARVWLDVQPGLQRRNWGGDAFPSKAPRSDLRITP
jgi:hypothetical protein